MNIDKMIEQWQEKHSSLLNDYSKGNANNEVMQMYRSQMKNVLDFINELKQVKNLSSNNTVLADSLPLSAEAFAEWFDKKYDFDKYKPIGDCMKDWVALAKR